MKKKKEEKSISKEEKIKKSFRSYMIVFEVIMYVLIITGIGILLVNGIEFINSDLSLNEFLSKFMTAFTIW